ncbi:hypothetical protein [Prevotella corporis]|uniref:hypothetical protein n=1 Tax=Prevotella corporis TaxID=28128 RepID=UPI0030B87F9A
MEQKNGFSERNPEVFSNSICMVTSLKRCDREREKIRLTYPTSKAATVEYLKNRFDEDVDLSKIY